MATKKSQLFRLIATLKPAEKAYFKKYGFKHSGAEKAPFFLFDCITQELKKSTTLADSDLIQIFKQKYPKLNYTKVKSRLLQLLLAALRDYDRPQNELDKIFDYIAYAASLSKRSLFEDAVQMLRKAEKLANAYEQVELQVLIKSNSNFYERFAQKYGPLEKGLANIDAIQVHLETLNKKVAADRAIYQILHFQKTIGFPRVKADFERLEAIKNHPTFSSDYSPPLTSAKYDLAIAKSGICFALGDAQTALDICTQFIDHQQTDNKLHRKYHSKYLALLDCLLQAALLSLKPSIYEQYYPLLKQFKPKGQDEQNLKTGIDLYVQCIYAIISNQPGQVSSLSPVFEKVKDQAFIPNFRKISIAYYLVFGSFLSKDFEQTYQLIQWMKANRNLGIRYDIEVGILCMESIILLSQQQLELLEYQLRSFDEFLKTRGRKFEMERLSLRFFRKLMNCSSSKQKHEILNFTKTQIEELLVAKPEEQAFLNAFDLQSWVLSELNVTAFQDVYYQKNIEIHVS